MQIATRSREHRGEALTNLHGYITPGFMAESYLGLNKKGASGVDGQSWADYAENYEQSIGTLHTAFKSGSYRAPHIRRAYIPKGRGQRPLGLPTVEDKILQSAVNRVLTPVYEQEFYSYSYGFRPGKSAHQALEALYKEVSYEGKRYIIDADLRNYFGSINHQQLRGFLDRRIKDGVIRRQIDKWLKAGILEDGQVHYPKEGTPQGGIISPLLGNIYLHYVLDEWFSEQVQGRLRGRSSLIRYADDFVMCFSDQADAERVLAVLPKRLGKYGLSLHEDKTRLIDLGSGKRGARSFDFLGFTHYLGRSRRGNAILKRKTSSRKLTESLHKVSQWIRQHRHRPIGQIVAELNRKLRGYYNYYGITFNSRGIVRYFEGVKRLLFKWINRRGGKRTWNWTRYNQLIKEWQPLLRPKVYHRYPLAKPL